MNAKAKKLNGAAPYDPGLLEDLKDINFAAEYLTACIDGIDDVDEAFAIFFSAFGEILKANGIQTTAKKMGISRDALYKMFREHQNPGSKTLLAALRAVDLDLAIRPRKRD